MTITGTGTGTGTAASAEPPSRMPPGWRVRRAVAHLAAAARAGFGLRDVGISSGAVLVRVPGPYSALVELLFRRRRSRRRVTLADELENYVVLEIRCLSGAETAFAQTVLEAAQRALTRPVAITRIPSVVFAGGNERAAGASSLHAALSRMGLQASSDAGENVVIAVIDNDLRTAALPQGVTVERPDVAKAARHIPFRPWNTKNLHGTAVVSLVAVAAPRAKIVFMDLPRELHYWLPILLEHARSYAAGRQLVCNLSWAYSIGALEEGERSVFRDIVDGALGAAGYWAVVTAAAGNLEPGETNAEPMAYPAASQHVLAVAAAKDDGQLAARSRRGKASGDWCLAPGGFLADETSYPLVSIGGQDFGDTSMACALASAFIASSFGSLTPIEMLAELTNSFSRSESNRLLRRTPSPPQP